MRTATRTATVITVTAALALSSAGAAAAATTTTPAKPSAANSILTKKEVKSVVGFKQVGQGQKSTQGLKPGQKAYLAAYQSGNEAHPYYVAVTGSLTGKSFKQVQKEMSTIDGGMVVESAVFNSKTQTGTVKYHGYQIVPVNTEHGTVNVETGLAGVARIKGKTAVVSMVAYFPQLGGHKKGAYTKATQSNNILAKKHHI